MSPTILEVLRRYQTKLKNDDLEFERELWDEHGEIGACDEMGNPYLEPERLQDERIKVIKRMIDGRKRIEKALGYLNAELSNDDSWVGIIVESAIHAAIYEKKEREDYRITIELSEKVKKSAEALYDALVTASVHADGRGMDIPACVDKAFHDPGVTSHLWNLMLMTPKEPGCFAHSYIPPPSREANLHGAFVAHLDWQLSELSYIDAEGQFASGIHLSNGDMARLAEVCLELPHGSVNPKSIRHKRVKLDAWKIG